MIEAVICEPIRTPVGRYGGVFKDVPAVALAEAVIRALVERAKLAPDDIDDIIFGQCYPNGEAPAIGRIAGLDGGLGTGIPGMQIDRRCGSGLQAVIDAAMRVQTGVADLVIAGGAESMSQAEHYVIGSRFGIRGDQQPFWDRIARGRITSGGRFHPVAGGMLETAENLRREFSIARDAQDQLAYDSHHHAAAAQADGRFADEIIPVEVKGRKGPVMVDSDEHIRPEITMEALAGLRAVREKLDPDSTVTAGNASGQNDGAAACIVASRAKAEALGLKPLGRLAGWAVAGVEPERMGFGPVPAVERLFARTDLGMKDMDLIEINEAFAAQVLACTGALGFGAGDMQRLNVNGSGISLGHPVGATGVRILTTMLRELDRRGARYGLETMCIGGGQGLAAIFERVS
jgi:acetyl-CoA C-acetyltransferase